MVNRTAAAQLLTVTCEPPMRLSAWEEAKPVSVIWGPAGSPEMLQGSKACKSELENNCASVFGAVGFQPLRAKY